MTAIIKATLQKTLNGKKYEAEKVPELITSISNEILAEVKSMFLVISTCISPQLLLPPLFLELGYERYKIVVQVDVGEFKGQGIKLASRCVWDTTTDTWASGSFKNVRIADNWSTHHISSTHSHVFLSSCLYHPTRLHYLLSPWYSVAITNKGYF